MSKDARRIIDELARDLKGAAIDENAPRVDALLMIVLELAASHAELAARVDALEAEANERSRAAAEEDLPSRPPGRWISLKEAAFRSGFSLGWVRKWRVEGVILEHEEGGHVLVNVESLERAIVRSSRTKKTVRPLAHDKI